MLGDGSGSADPSGGAPLVIHSRIRIEGREVVQSGGTHVALKQGTT